MFKPHQDLRADRTLGMQLEFHCPRRNRIAPNIISLKLEAGSPDPQRNSAGLPEMGGYVKEQLIER